MIVWFQCLNATQACCQEQLRDKDRRRTNDADEQRALFEGLQNRLMELQVGVRNGNVKISMGFILAKFANFLGPGSPEVSGKFGFVSGKSGTTSYCNLAS